MTGSAPATANAPVDSDGAVLWNRTYHDTYYFEGRKEIDIEVRGREPGNYSGKVHLDFQIPENQVGERWLDLKHWFQGLR